MRTTLDIDDDLLIAARELAARQRRSCGEVVSMLLRKSLAPELSTNQRNGISLFPRQPDAGVVTLEHVNALRDELPDTPRGVRESGLGRTFQSKES